MSTLPTSRRLSTKTGSANRGSLPGPLRRTSNSGNAKSGLEIASAACALIFSSVSGRVKVIIFAADTLEVSPLTNPLLRLKSTSILAYTSPSTVEGGLVTLRKFSVKIFSRALMTRKRTSNISPLPTSLPVTARSTDTSPYSSTASAFNCRAVHPAKSPVKTI